MDRPKHHWFVFLGLIVVGALLLLGRGLLHKAENGAESTSPAAVRPAERSPIGAELQPGNAALPEAKPAPAAKGSSIRGLVVDAATRQPVKNFEIQLQRLDGSSDEEPPVVRSFQSDNGRFEWQDAPVGLWYLTVAAPDYQRFEIARFGIAADQETRQLIVPLLRGYKITGRVFEQSSGAGIAGASINYGSAGGESKRDGSFVLRGVPAGKGTLRVHAPKYAMQEVSVVVNEDTGPVEIGLSSGGTISGFLVTPSGAPIAGPVALANEQNFRNIKSTSEAGAFSFDQLPPGRYRVGGGAAWHDITLARDERREGIIVTAPASQGVNVRGTVRGLRPEELKRSVVVLRSEHRDTTAMRPPDEYGSFVLKGVPPGPAEITVEGSSRRLQQRIEVPTDAELVVDLEFAAGARLSGRVTQGGKPVTAGKSVTIDEQAGARRRLYRTATSADGRYRIEGIEAGEYMAFVEDDATPRPIRIAGEDVVLDFEIPMVELAGRVLEAQGTVPIVGATVHVVGLDSATLGVRFAKVSDHFGQFALNDLEPGDLLLSAYKPGYELFRERLAYSSPVTDMTIRLRRSTGVEIKARFEATGTAVRDLAVAELMQDSRLGITLWMQLNENGIGSLPAGLAGSTLSIRGGEDRIVIPEWDGEPLDLKFR